MNCKQECVRYVYAAVEIPTVQGNKGTSTVRKQFCPAKGGTISPFACFDFLLVKFRLGQVFNLVGRERLPLFWMK